MLSTKETKTISSKNEKYSSLMNIQDVLCLGEDIASDCIKLSRLKKAYKYKKNQEH